MVSLTIFTGESIQTKITFRKKDIFFNDYIVIGIDRGAMLLRRTLILTHVSLKLYNNLEKI